MKTALTAALFPSSNWITFLDRLRHYMVLAMILLLFAPSWAEAQVVDTAMIYREVDSLITVNRNLIRQKDYNGALQAVELAEGKASGTLGKQSSLYARCLFNHGRTLQMMRRLEDAEIHYLEAKSIWKKLPPGDPDYESTLNNLGALYNGQHRFDEAEENLLEVIAIREQTGHPDLSKNLVNLGNTYLGRGRYEAAERCHAKVVTIRAGLTGKKGYEYANALNGLATVQHRLGRFENAELLYLEALPLFRDTLGENDPKYLSFLGNLAQLYSDMGRFEKAEPVMQQIIQLIGQDHPLYGVNINNLGQIYYYTVRYTEAEAMFKKALDAKEKQFTKQHRSYVETLDYLASVYIITNRYAEAELLYKEALTILENLNGKAHPNYVSSLTNLATLYKAIEQFEKAEILFKEVSSIIESSIKNAQIHMSEQELDNYLNEFSGYLNQVFSFVKITGSPELIPTCYNNSLLLKDLQLQYSNYLRRVAVKDAAAFEIFVRLKGYLGCLSVEYAKPIAERKGVEKLEEKAKDLEKELVRSVAGFGETQRQVSWHEVRDILQPNEASIEFVRYKYNDQKAHATDSTMYAALLLLPGATAPQFIPLFEERQIQALLPADKAIEDLSKSGQRANYIQNLYANPALYELLWAPIEKALAEKNIQIVYFSPAGILHRLNLGAIADDSRAPLANRYRLVQLGSTRELVTDRHANQPKPVSAIVYGGVQYEMDSTAIAQANRNLGATPQDTTGGLFRYSPHNSQSGGTRGEDFNYLQGSEVEARHLHELLQQQGVSSTLRMGYSATEESFKQIGQNGPSPSLLHIGTHGFFFPDPKDITRRSTLMIGDSALAFKISEHPLIRSGLLLAGSRYAWEQKRPMPGMEDGILTAHEVSQMNLSNTDLVVLSACETGLGDIKGNEGVYGLQRAFRIAGAKNVLMSLWKVSDEATALLLNRFYENWLQKGLPVRTALEEAQSWMRGQELYRNPYYWAGFVLVGE